MGCACCHIASFLSAAGTDCRVSPTHISLYAAIWKAWVEQGCPDLVQIIRQDIMRNARIGSKGTYFQCIGDLRDFGYILYKPAEHRYGISRADLTSTPVYFGCVCNHLVCHFPSTSGKLAER